MQEIVRHNIAHRQLEYNFIQAWFNSLRHRPFSENVQNVSPIGSRSIIIRSSPYFPILRLVLLCRWEDQFMCRQKLLLWWFDRGRKFAITVGSSGCVVQKNAWMDFTNYMLWMTMIGKKDLSQIKSQQLKGASALSPIMTTNMLLTYISNNMQIRFEVLDKYSQNIIIHVSCLNKVPND